MSACNIYEDIVRHRSVRPDADEAEEDQMVELERISSHNCVVLRALDINLSDLRDADKDAKITINEEQSLHEFLTVERIKEFKKQFQLQESDNKIGLTSQQFKTAMHKITKNSIANNIIENLFMKIDVDSDNLVTWEEFVNYLLLDYSVKDRIRQMALEPYSREVSTVHTDNHDVIVAFFFVPTSASEMATGGIGSYCSVSRDGFLCFWPLDLVSPETHRIDAGIGKVHVAKWALAAEVMPDAKMIAIAVNNFSLCFFHYSLKAVCVTCRITQLPACITCLSYHKDSSGRTPFSYLCWGDENGGLGVICFKENPILTPLGNIATEPTSTKLKCPEYFFTDLSNDHVADIESRYLAGIHKCLVQQIRFVRKLHTFISCCKDTCTALHIGDLVQKPKDQRLYYIVEKGINVFDYCEELNLLLTGGFDSTIRIWNPLRKDAKLVGVLRGHSTPVDHIVISPKLEIVVTVAENKDIRIFDINNQMCIQTIPRKSLEEMGPRPLSAVFLNPRSNRILMASRCIAYIQSKEEANRQQRLVSLTNGITCLVYNDLYKQVITGDMKSQVIVWDLFTGNKISQFTVLTVHQRGIEEAVEVTCMTLDDSKRRLLTGTKLGIVKVWDFNIGGIISTLPLVDNTEITALCWPPGRLFVGGWNGRVVMHMEATEVEKYHLLKPSHESDITSMAVIAPICLVTVSSDGTMLLFDLKTCLPLLRLKIDDPDLIPVSNFYTVEKSRPTPVKATRLSKKVVRDLPSEIPLAMRADNCVEQIVFLAKRKFNDDTAILFTCLNNGYVYCWPYSFHKARLGYFFAAYAPGESVTSGCASVDNDFFITGDSLGYVKVWDITHYLNAEVASCCKKIDSTRYATWFKFPFVRIRNHIDAISKSSFKTDLPLHLNVKCFRSATKNENTPHLINSFRAHMGSIISLKLAEIENRRFLITSATDWSIRLYSITGLFMGIFNQKLNWLNIKENLYKYKEIESFVNPNQAKDSHLKDAGRRLITFPGDDEVDDGEELKAIFAAMQVILKPTVPDGVVKAAPRRSLVMDRIPIPVQTETNIEEDEAEGNEVDDGESVASPVAAPEFVQEVESDTEVEVGPSTNIPTDLRRTSSFTTMYILEMEAGLRPLSRWNKIRDAVVWLVNFLRSRKSKEYKLFKLPGGKGRRVDMYSNQLKDLLEAYREDMLTLQGVDNPGMLKMSEVEKETMLLRPLTPLSSALLRDAYVPRTHYRPITLLPLNNMYGRQLKPYHMLELAETELFNQDKILNASFMRALTTGFEGIALPPIDRYAGLVVARKTSDPKSKLVSSLKKAGWALKIGGSLERSRPPLNGPFQGSYLQPTFYSTIPEEERMRQDARCKRRKKSRLSRM